MRLEHFVDLAERCWETGFGFAEFRRHDSVASLGWPDDVVEQWIYDHASSPSFLRDYEHVDLSLVRWDVEALPVDVFMTMPTGPSDAEDIDYFASNPDRWVEARKHGVHRGVALAWEVHGTWKRWPIILDRALLDPAGTGLQLVEGRNRVGILRGFHRRGTTVAGKHLVWVGRPRT